MKIEIFVLSLFKHKRLYSVICISMVIATFFRIPELEIWLLPKLTPARFFILTEFPNHSAEDTDRMVSLPISEMISSVKFVERIRTISEHNKSIVQIDLQFDVSTRDFKEDLYQTILEMKDKLPFGVGTSRLVQGEIDDHPFFEILIPKEGSSDLSQLQFHLKQLVFQLERISGVTEVRISGNPIKSSFISLRPQVLDVFPINIHELELQILAGIRGGSLGLVEEYTNETELKFSPDILNHQNLFEFPIHLGNGNSVSLGRLASIYEAESPKEKLTRFNGKDSIYISIFTESVANPLKLSSEIKSKLENSDPILASEIFYDGSTELQNQITQSAFNMIWGLGFAFLFSFLLYRSLMPALILFGSVLFSLVLFFHLILFFSISINLLSLGGISVGIGLLFDASNLTVFAIRKHLSENFPTLDAVTQGIRSVLVSLISSSLTTIVVFIPLLFYQMHWRDFFFDSGVCIALLVFCSFVSSVFVVPLLSILMSEKLKYKNKKSIIEDFLLRIYNNTNHLFSLRNLRIVMFVMVLVSFFCYFCLGLKFEIFPKQSPVGIRLQMVPKHQMSLEEELRFVYALEKKIKIFDPELSSFVSPIYSYDDKVQHPQKAIPIEFKFLGFTKEKELDLIFSHEHWQSKWDWKLEQIRSQVTRALPFIPIDSVTFLHENWEELKQIAINFQSQSNTKSSDGKFDFLPKTITLEDWSRTQIPDPAWHPNEEDLKQKFLYEQSPKYLGSFGDINKTDLYLGLEPFLSKETNSNEFSTISFKTKTNESTFLSTLFTTKKKESLDQFRRESGLFYLEWVGQILDLDPMVLDPKGRLSLLKVSLDEEIKKFYLILLILLLVSLLFIYLALVGIYESFRIPAFYLLIAFVYLVVTYIFIICLFSNFHLGHYIGFVVLLGLSIDSISLFGERWVEVSNHIVAASERQENVFRWLALPIVLNAGTTMMGLFPVIFFVSPGSEFSRSIATTMFVGILISLIFVFYLYPLFFQKFWKKIQ